MQNYCKTIGALAAASALVAGNAIAEVEYQLHTGYSNEYLFRGVNNGKDLVETGLNASTEVSGIALSAGAWYANYDKNTPFGSANFNEIDLYTSVSKDLGFATASVGYIYYANSADKSLKNGAAEADAFTAGGPQPTDFVGEYRSATADYQEVSFGLSRDLGFATASLTYFWDIVGDNNGYSEFALGRSVELSPCLTLNLGGNVGYLAEQGQATALTLKASLDYGFAEHAKLSPFVTQSIALSDDVNTVYGGSENETVAGAMVSVSF